MEKFIIAASENVPEEVVQTMQDVLSEGHTRVRASRINEDVTIYFLRMPIGRALSRKIVALWRKIWSK